MNWYGIYKQSQSFTNVLDPDEYPWGNVLHELLEGDIDRVNQILHEIEFLTPSQFVVNILYRQDFEHPEYHEQMTEIPQIEISTTS